MPPKRTSARTAKAVAGKKQTAPKKAAVEKPAKPAPKKAAKRALKAAPKTDSKKTSKKRDAAASAKDEPTGGGSRKRTQTGASSARPAKKPRTVKEPARRAAAKKRTQAVPQTEETAPPPLNSPPQEVLSVFVFGSGDGGELGLGPGTQEVLRPRRNGFLDASEPGGFAVVQVACGGMHSVALTRDNQIVTWGVNDKGALGRDVTWAGVLRDADAADESGDEDTDADEDALNPRESTPTAIPADCFPAGTVFTAVAAGDSCSLALAADGSVYGWGTFLDSNGNEGFSVDADGNLVKIQREPVRIDGLRDIVQIVCGANHALARDAHGAVWTWGVGEQDQLGRPLATAAVDDYVPGSVEVSRAGVRYIASGPYHSFAVDGRGHVWGWGANSFGQAGDAATAGEDRARLPYPTKIPALSRAGVTMLAGGSHHSAAVTGQGSGQCLVWGRIDGGQLGVVFRPDQLADDTLVRRDERDMPRICLKPVPVPEVTGRGVCVACASGHTLFVNDAGQAWAAGLGSMGQLGQGSYDDIEDGAKPLTGKAVRERVLTWAGAGGQFSMVAGPAGGSDEQKVLS